MIILMLRLNIAAEGYKKIDQAVPKSYFLGQPLFHFGHENGRYLPLEMRIFVRYYEYNN